MRQDKAVAQKPTDLLVSLLSLGDLRWWLVRCLPILGVILYTYWPTFVWFEDSWRNEPDYSHGYLVPILAVMLLSHRSDSFPGVRSEASYGGISLILLAIVMRFVGRLLYMDFLDGYSLLPLIAGITWVMLGPTAMKWCLPAIGFLFFMIPLPYQAESMLSWKLQGVATTLSMAMLRVLGQPAVSEGHIIWIADQKLLVEQACSGLRIFIGVGALAFFWAAMVKRNWLDRVVLLAAVLPLAVLVNALRITVVGLLYQWFGDQASRATIQDWSGYLMIPAAFGLLWLLKSYWELLYRPVEQVTAKDFVRSSA